MAGFHFFNPVPLMKVVEVVAGALTESSPRPARRACRRMGHTPVRAQDTPGFIVNHAGRGYVTEALALLREGVADVATIDALLRDAAGFPPALRTARSDRARCLAAGDGVDLPPVLRRSALPPSPIAAQRFAAGLLGRKERARLLSLRRAARSGTAGVDGGAVGGPVWVSDAQPEAATATRQLLQRLGRRLKAAPG